MSGSSPPTTTTAGPSSSPSKASPLAKMTTADSLTPMMNLGDSPSRTKPTTTAMTTSPFDSASNTHASTSASAGANNLLQRARLAASLNSSSLPSAGAGGQTPMPATMTDLHLTSTATGQRGAVSSSHRVIEDECEQFERALTVLDQLGEEFYDGVGRVTGNEAVDVHGVQASLQNLLAHLQHLLTFAAQTSIGGVPVRNSSQEDSMPAAESADTDPLTAALPDQITDLSDNGAALYNRLRGVRDASGIVASVVSGGRAR